jgi:hypothetical protein
MSSRRACQERKKEAREPDRARLLPFEPENDGIKLGARKKRQDDRADSREKLDPGLVGSEDRRADRSADDELGDGPDDDLSAST